MEEALERIISEVPFIVKIRVAGAWGCDPVSLQLNAAKPNIPKLTFFPLFFFPCLLDGIIDFFVPCLLLLFIVVSCLSFLFFLLGGA